MSTLNTLREGLVDQLKDIYSAEKQLLKALPKMEKKAVNAKLKKAFNSHIKETETQVSRLEQIASILDEKLTGKTCKAMQGLIEEGKEVLEIKSDNDALVDVLLVAAAQRVEHYEIAAYGTVSAMSKELGEVKIAQLLDDSLNEESAADEKLTAICEDSLFVEANAEEESEEDDDEDSPPMKKKSPSLNSSNTKKAGNGLRALMITSAIIGTYFVNPIVIAEETANRAATEENANKYKADNTGRNVRDRGAMRNTADDQKNNANDLQVLARIRKEIVSQDDLSVDSHNVKILVENGTVTLRGPVKSEAERVRIEEISTRLAAGYKVINQLEIAPS